MNERNKVISCRRCRGTGRRNGALCLPCKGSGGIVITVARPGGWRIRKKK